MDNILNKAVEKPKFEFSSGFNETCESMFNVYDKTMFELSKVISGKTVAPDEYGVCNSGYSFRYISPDDIAEFTSNLIKVISGKMISPNVTDVEKFAVKSACMFVENHNCTPFKWETIYDENRYARYDMGLSDLVVMCQNEFFNTVVLSKYEMDRRRDIAKRDYTTLNSLHYTANMRKIVNRLPDLMKHTEFENFDYAERRAIEAFVESFITFATAINIASVASMTMFCVPRSTYNSALRHHELDVDSNSLLDDKYYTECCLLKTNNILIKNKIPFNINMRNIVLQDMHPEFKDTVSAVKFILKDNRSPISKLIWKYGSYDIKNKINGETIVRMFIGHPACKAKGYSNAGVFFNTVDFHTDVNWLDKITYGDPYQASNYRDMDSVGNDHKHPIHMTLELLYKMYGDQNCKTNQELADNIQIVGECMIEIAGIYKDCGIVNWELVRDILAVFGEIMTKCIIKLYNNHMTVIVVSDDMDDTMSPAYMYSESYGMLVDEFDFIMEDGETKPTVTVTNADSKSNQSKGTVKKIIGKGKEALAQIMQKFSGWIRDSLSKAPQKFIDVHKSEIDWVSKHADLNNKIGSALGNEFNPHIEGWPLYKIPANNLAKAKISGIIDNVSKDPSQISVENIKNKFYNTIDPNLAKAMSGVMNKSNAGDAKDRDVSQEKTAIENYILYGNTNPTETTTNNPNGNNWKDLINNIVQAGPALDKILKPSTDDISKTLDKLNKDLKAAQDQQKQQNQTKTESVEYDVYNPYFMEAEETNNNNTGTNTADAPTPPAQQTSDNGKATGQSVNNVDTSGSSGKLTVDQIQTMFNAVQDISGTFSVGITTAMDKKFYRTCYNLYRDMVNAYKQTNGNFQDQNTTNNEETEDANDVMKDINEELGNDDGNAGNEN